MASIHQTNIDIFLHHIQSNDIKYIYGGITELNTEEKRKLHLIHKNIPNINSSWVISKAITSITINTSKHNIEYYKEIINIVEKYLIEQLHIKYGKKCKNVKFKEGFIQNIQNIQPIKGEVYKVYICYQLID